MHDVPPDPSAIDRLPWPTVKGKRCLDVGTGDDDVAFELARRGAAEVVAIDVDDLDPADVGVFDVVVGRSVLWQLRDPRRALESIRSVTNGLFLSSEPIDLWSSVLGRGQPRYRLDGGQDGASFIANAAGHVRMLHTAGFEIEQKSKPFVVGFDEPPQPARSLRDGVERFAIRLLTRQHTPGVLHRAVLCRPRT